MKKFNKPQIIKKGENGQKNPKTTHLVKSPCQVSRFPKSNIK